MSKIADRSFQPSLAHERIKTKGKGEKRAPMRSHKEMAQEFGMSEGALTRRITDHPELNPPKYMITGRNHYYNPAELRAWLKRYNEMKQPTTGQ